MPQGSFGDAKAELCDAPLNSFVAVKAADEPDGLSVLWDACDSIDLQPSALSLLLNNWKWILERADAPADDLLLEAWRSASGEQELVEWVLEALHETGADLLEPPFVDGLREACIATIITAGDAGRATDVLWNAFNPAVFDERQGWLDEMMEAYRNAIHAVSDPVGLVDPLFEALSLAVSNEQSSWLPDAGLVADACLEAIGAEGGPVAAVDATLNAVDSACLECFDESVAVEMLCRLYREAATGADRSDEALDLTVEVLERVSRTTGDPTETTEALSEGLRKAAKAQDDPSRYAARLLGTLMTDSVTADDACWAAEPLLEGAKEAIKRAPHQTEALGVLLKVLGQHRPRERMISLGWTRALVVTSSGDWIHQSG